MVFMVCFALLQTILFEYTIGQADSDYSLGGLKDSSKAIQVVSKRFYGGIIPLRISYYPNPRLCKPMLNFTDMSWMTITEMS
jgi:hypothetical protein